MPSGPVAGSMESVMQAADSISGDVRERRKWRASLAGGIVLATGPAFGLLGTVFGMLHSFHTIETLKAPTPGDLATGVNISVVATTIGAVAGMVGVPLVVLSCVRLAKFWNEPTSPSDS